MARKNNRPKPGPDGYLLTGIYKKYVGKPKPEHQLTFENAKVAAAELDTPVGDYLARIRAWLSKFILPHIDGPLSEQESRQWVGHFYGLDFGDGVATYREKATLNAQEQCVIDAFHDGVEALNQIRLIELHAGDDGKPNSVVPSFIHGSHLAQGDAPL